MGTTSPTPGESQQEDALSNKRKSKGLFALFTLIIQNSTVALTMRYSRTVADPQNMYISSTAVVTAEILKLLLSFSFVFYEEKTWRKFQQRLDNEMLKRMGDMLKLSVPAILYVIQNNLAYVAISNLDAASYQVLYQLKILTTAIFSVILLKKKLDMSKWFALVILIAGVSLVQLSGLKGSSSSQGDKNSNSVLGLVCILAACCSSGFAGVWFEKVLKGTSEVSLWVRNIELALIGIIVALLNVYFHDAERVSENGFFYGYNTVVWSVVALQAAGGIIVALVIKHADNLLKGFATSVSIILSCVLSSLFFDDFVFSFQFFLGTLLVIMSTLQYSRSNFRGAELLLPLSGSTSRTPLSTVKDWLQLATTQIASSVFPMHQDGNKSLSHSMHRFTPIDEEESKEERIVYPTELYK